MFKSVIEAPSKIFVPAHYRVRVESLPFSSRADNYWKSVSRLTLRRLNQSKLFANFFKDFQNMIKLGIGVGGHIAGAQ